MGPDDGGGFYRRLRDTGGKDDAEWGGLVLPVAAEAAVLVVGRLRRCKRQRMAAAEHSVKTSLD